MGPTPFDLELIHAGIDKVIKVQAEKGHIQTGRIAPEMDSNGQGYWVTQRNASFKNANVYGRGQTIEPSRKEKLDTYQWDPLLWALAWDFQIYDKDEDFYKELPQNIADAAISMLRTRDIEECGLFNNGFSASYVYVDGVALFSTAHTGATGVAATQANRPTTGSSLDAESLEALYTLWMNQTDFNGELKYNTGSLEVWSGPLLAPQLWRIINTEFQAGTPDNDKSYVHRLMKAMMAHQLTSSTAYYAKTTDETQHNLRTIIFSPYQVTQLPTDGALQDRTVVWERRRVTVGDWHGTVADPGA